MCSETANTVEFNSNLQFNIDQTLSIYIPSILDEYANPQYIRSIFQNLNIGIVKRVDFQPINTSSTSSDKMAFVHMLYWYTNVVVENLQERINSTGLEARIVYDDPHYWVLQKNKRPIPDNYAEQLVQLQKSAFEVNQQMNSRITNLEQKNTELETTLAHMQWWIRLHDANINYMCNKFGLNGGETSVLSSTDVDTTNTMTNMATTDAQVATNQVATNTQNIWSTENNAWAKRLRTRSRYM